ncbi:hypothetical protein QAD02_019561 [Eretmocerus hayati]|uniref:Uncharacterized protein n=1 Tax=Eretmocerus hayati TaxID=131215 RepID=A0ACC2PJL3_9HYME|nr:hypothetical protein QAD02_019561 [Eretmocerus hayati]
MLSFIVILGVLGIITADPIVYTQAQGKPSFGITGGDIAVIEDHPYGVILEIDSRVTCTASIVSNNYIITRGDCAREIERRGIIRAGSSQKGRNGTEHNVDKVISHEDFKGNVMGLIRIKEPFQFDQTHQVIPLFDKDEEIETGTVGIVIGWGFTENDRRNKNDHSYKINMTVLDDEVCKQEYDQEYESGKMICAINNEHKGKDICWFDYADPLVIDGRLAGIVLGNEDLCTGNKPVIFAKIAHYHDWIMEIIQQ